MHREAREWKHGGSIAPLPFQKGDKGDGDALS